MTFEEWFKAKYPSQYVFKESTLTCKSFYDGASVAWDYKQAEIDALIAKKEFRDLSQDLAIKNIKDGYEKQVAGLAKSINKLCNENDALQKRIDLIVDLVHDQTTDYFLDNLIQDILKGDKND